MRYPYDMTAEDIELFELDMCRMELDASFVFDQVNLDLNWHSEQEKRRAAVDLYEDWG